MAAHEAAEVVFTVNSPGEVATWLTPVVGALRKRAPRISITVFILPCTFASGTETDVVSRIPGVDNVIPPGEALRHALWKRYTATVESPRRVLVFLGGEFLLAARFARKLRCPALAYTEGYINSANQFSNVFVPTSGIRDDVVRKGVPSDRVRVVGNLMVDAARPSGKDIDAKRLRRDLGLRLDSRVVSLLPGSRSNEVRRMAHLLAEVALTLQAQFADLEFVFLLSPFVAEEALAASLRELEERSTSVEAGAPIHVGTARDGKSITVDAGRSKVEILLHRGESTEAIAVSHLALTIPGSNTAELAIWGVPMVVCLPLDRLDEIPVEGIFGLVGSLPLVGARLKSWGVRKLVERTKFTALPNRFAQRFIVPEVRGDSIDADDIAEEAAKMLSDPAARESISTELQGVFGEPGAADQIAERALDLL